MCSSKIIVVSTLHKPDAQISVEIRFLLIDGSVLRYIRFLNEFATEGKILSIRDGF